MAAGKGQVRRIQLTFIVHGFRNVCVTSESTLKEVLLALPGHVQAVTRNRAARRTYSQLRPNQPLLSCERSHTLGECASHSLVGTVLLRIEE